MKINVTQKLVSFKGETLKGEGNEEATLRSVCVNALLGFYPKEEITGTEKMERYKLAKLIDSEDEPDLESEQITKIKDLVAKSMTTIVVGQAWQMLEKKLETEK